MKEAEGFLMCKNGSGRANDAGGGNRASPVSQPVDSRALSLVTGEGGGGGNGGRGEKGILPGEIQRPRWVGSSQVAGGVGSVLEGRTIARWGANISRLVFLGWGGVQQDATPKPNGNSGGHEALLSRWPAIASKFHFGLDSG
jgi:hypothetical protein